MDLVPGSTGTEYIAYVAMPLFAAASLAWFWTDLTFRRARVINVSDADQFSCQVPVGMIRQKENTCAIQKFRHLMPQFAAPALSLERAIRIRHWVRSLQSGPREQWIPVSDRGVTDPFVLLHELANHHPGACRRLAYVAAAALIADGYHARVVHAAAGFSNRADGHTMTEVWVPKLEKWVLIDATYDVTYFVGNTPASLLDMHRIWHNSLQEDLAIDDGGVIGWPRISSRHEFVSSFRHIFALQTVDIFDGRNGRSFFPSRRLAFIHLTDGCNRPYPSWRKALAAGGSMTAILVFSLLVFSAVG